MSDLSHLGGWINDPKGVDLAMQGLPFPVFSMQHQAIKDTGAGKKMLLYDIIRRVPERFLCVHRKLETV